MSTYPSYGTTVVIETPSTVEPNITVTSVESDNDDPIFDPIQALRRLHVSRLRTDVIVALYPDMFASQPYIFVDECKRMAQQYGIRTTVTKDDGLAYPSISG